MSVQPDAWEVEDALQSTGYCYSDPCADDEWPRITEHDESGPCADDLFPEGWGSKPTERDQAAIDAGNA